MKFKSNIFIRAKVITSTISVIFILSTLIACEKSISKNNQENVMDNQNQNKLEIATFGSGCFWCTVAIFERVKGVQKVISGYSGGTIENPTYKEVCTGTTGHAECTQIYYDPSVVTYDELLEIFWKTHDPTTLNRQGNDVGTQYRSVIFYHNQEQKEKAEFYKKKLEEEKIWDRPIVTEIVEFKKFYPAEDYHQNYYDKNPNQGYCAFVITPKVEKFEKIFKDKLKK
ncbi:Peptide methionine sulfoxide reductase [Ignavibacterium album JCM 16511]|uniref:Peptide methionine sulfoxide reductase MsrA n=1 Tax=Ignavibacterium album (strain DSM 19864 / JCM 16511 / NBRC 101810 / Mat9-16) TaxID=945713 RepID=I0AG10_IGNAJ|nr:peptide-methionine (S)-S-oxide reductase MsrA [Ignavibacterium album]AFH47917.1 Peptide methionine sulfoxide reductase [Ignavibacterium album JCM 16511]